MTQITKLFEKYLNLHKNYKYVEEKENLKKFAEFSLDEVLSFIQAYKKTENYSDKKAEVFHSLSSNLMESQQDNSVKALEKAIELDPNRAFYYEEYFNIFYKIKPKESIIFIKKAIQLNSNKESLYQDLVVLLKEIKVNEEAIKVTELIQDFPKNLSDLVSYIDKNISPSLLGLDNQVIEK